VFWNAYGDLRPVGYRPISDADLSALLERSGIGPDTTVAFYGYAAYLGFWLLSAHGHLRSCLMDGPRDRWSEAGYGWTTDVPPEPASGPYALAPATEDLTTRGTVLELIGDPDAVLVDVRSYEEYSGECFWPSGASEGGGRAGRVPGALWLPAELVRGPDGRLGDIAALRRLLLDAGVSPEYRVVVYCTIGNRASQVWYALRHLLHYPRVSVYYGSWAEWGTTRGLPVEAGAGAENGTTRGLPVEAGADA
jgi:thiosulfate/3-mercaptopyruvate sulfurtransferase